MINGEINIGGVFIPSIVIWSMIAFVIWYMIRRFLANRGFYRYLWHQSLFNISLFIILVGCITYLST